VQGRGNDADASQALDGFKRFPQWMWRNADVVDFIGWLRDYNDSIQIPQRIGFYGLDLYSLHASMGAVLSYLNRVDPEAALRARQRYACFDHFGEDPQTYGYATASGMTPSCESEVISQLMELQKSAAKYAALDGRMAADDLFFAEQNARVVLNAERYYRAMFGRRASTWNMRDEHMAGTLDSLIAFDTRSSETNLALIDFMQQYSARHDMESSLVFGETGRRANLLATSVRRTGRDSACPAIPM